MKSVFDKPVLRTTPVYMGKSSLKVIKRRQVTNSSQAMRLDFES